MRKSGNEKCDVEDCAKERKVGSGGRKLGQERDHTGLYARDLHSVTIHLCRK